MAQESLRPAVHRWHRPNDAVYGFLLRQQIQDSSDSLMQRQASLHRSVREVPGDIHIGSNEFPSQQAKYILVFLERLDFGLHFRNYTKIYCFSFRRRLRMNDDYESSDAQVGSLPAAEITGSSASVGQRGRWLEQRSFEREKSQSP